MTSFLKRLWQSIFEPGAPPVLVTATHISFAALTAVLLFLLVATRSLHFLALLVLAVGLWIAITWFVKEIAKIQLEMSKNANADQAATSGIDEAVTRESPEVAETSDISKTKPSTTKRKKRI